MLGGIRNILFLAEQNYVGPERTEILKINVNKEA